MIGDTLGNYRVVSRLGLGGMGAVYVGEHKLIGRKAAIKVLLPEFSSKQEIVERFFNEAKAGSAIGHPGIVQTIDFGYHSDGSAFLIMELLTGEPLNDRLDRLGKLPEDEAVRVARQCASALAAAHHAGIIHRDLKPGNIFLAEDPEMEAGERVKILDFGIAKLTDSRAAGDLRTRTGSMMGTPVYMSPEQCRGAGLVDHRSDIYSLGCVLFRMICGRPPFVAEGIGEIIASHLREPPPSMLSIVPTVSPALDAVVQRTLAKAPDARFSSMEELASVLQSLRQGGALRQSVLIRPGSSDGLHQRQLALPAGQPALAALPPAHGPLAALPAHHERARSDMTTTPLDARAAQAAVTAPDPTTLGSVASQRMYASQRRSRRGLIIASAMIATAGLVGIVLAIADQSDEIAATPGSDPSVLPGAVAGSATGGAAENDAPAPGAAPGNTAAGAPGNAETGASAPPAELAQAEAATAAATEEPATTDLAPPAAPGAQVTKVLITSTPSGAEVYDPDKRELIDETPFEYTLPEGVRTVTLSVRSEGYRSKEIEIAAGRTEPFDVTLQRMPERTPDRKQQSKPDRKQQSKPDSKPKPNPLERM